MAVRLACPACGTAFTPKPADAGRVVPCARCGSDLQMPAAAPGAARPVAKRPAPPPEPDAFDEDERPRRRERAAAGASLLWLWVLLGSGIVGTFVGAAVFYFALREQPADPGPVAAKPPVAPPVEQQPPKVDPPKVDPPKVNPPKVDPPKPDPPKIVPPKPPDPIVAPGAPGALVAASTLPGLKFYLSCDAINGGKVTEVVSRKPVGTGAGLALTDGPRGKALRLTHDRRDANRHALDLADARDQFTIPADRPFTLAFWARRVHADADSGFGTYLFDASTDHGARHSRALRLQLLPARVATLAAVTLTDMSDRGDRDALKVAEPHHRVPDAEAWTHYALIRDNGKVVLLINGAPAPDTRAIPFPGELRYDALGLLRSSDGKTVIDLDEFCLFDRALADAELGALTGLKIAPRPKEPVIAEAKLPPPGAVPAANTIPGLKFYLPCDAINGVALAEAISGQNVGKARKLELVDGPRGKGVRTTVFGLGADREGFILSEHVDALAIGEGKPFTMALWVRTDNWDNIGGSFLYAQLGDADKFRSLTLYRYTKGFGFLLQQGKPGGGDAPINQLARGTREMAPTKGWVHLALTRDEKGTVRMVIDGAADVTAVGPYTAELQFTSFVLAWQQGVAFTADFDEFCLFDRVLTDAELARLAGKGKGGAVVVVGPKDPPVVAPKPPIDVAIAPPPRVAMIAEALPVAPFPAVVGPKVPVVVPPEVAVTAPAGVDPKGLLLYLPFDEAKDGTVREGTSGKFAGKCEGVELVKGARGNAARLSDQRADGAEGTCRLDFGDLADRTNVAAAKPFTLALWVRVEPREPGTKVSGTAVQLGARPDREYDRALQIGFGAAGTLHCAARSTPDRLDSKRETAARWAGVANPVKWQHLAMVRDEKNAVRWYLNGKVVPQPGKPDPIWDGPLGFDRVFIGDPEQTKTVLEVDELCLFDRVLTADELKKLSEPPK